MFCLHSGLEGCSWDLCFEEIKEDICMNYRLKMLSSSSLRWLLVIEKSCTERMSTPQLVGDWNTTGLGMMDFACQRNIFDGFVPQLLAAFQRERRQVMREQERTRRTTAASFFIHCLSPWWFSTTVVRIIVCLHWWSGIAAIASIIVLNHPTNRPTKQPSIQPASQPSTHPPTNPTNQPTNHNSGHSATSFVKTAPKTIMSPENEGDPFRFGMAPFFEEIY